MPIKDEVCESLKKWRHSFSALKLKQEVLYCMTFLVLCLPPPSSLLFFFLGETRNIFSLNDPKVTVIDMQHLQWGLHLCTPSLD